MQPKFRALRAARRFSGARGGNVAMLWALCATAIIGLVGLTVDFSRAQALRSEMQNAADGAALVAQRNASLSFSQREAAARAFFDQSLGAQPDTSGLDFVLLPLTPAGHRVTASLDLQTGLSRALNLISGTNHNSLHVGVSADALSQVSPPIEMVLSLDNTGSMSNDMQALRDAADDLANDIYDLAVLPTDVSIGLVPFVAQVNIGNGQTQMGWMDTAGTSPHNGMIFEGRQLGYRSWQNAYGTNCQNLNVNPTNVPFAGYPGAYRIFWHRSGTAATSYCVAFAPNSGINYFDLFTLINTQWKGCVEARPEPFDITDDPPTSPETRFVPFFSVDGEDNNYLPDNAINNTTGIATAAPSIFGNVASVRMTYQVNAAVNPTAANKTRSNTFNVFRYRGQNPNPALDTTPPTTTGPNMGCPTPIVPLTNQGSRATIINAIAAMQHWNGGGTDQIEGLVWGWRVLSPGQPFDQGRAYNVAGQAPTVRKVLVLMTDGENTNLDDNTVLGSDYAAYNHLGMWTSNIATPPPNNPANGFSSGVTVSFTGNPAASTLMGSLPAQYRRPITSTSSYVSRIDSREATLCTNIKNAGIEIYTVRFREPSSTVQAMLEACASTPTATHAYAANNAAELAAAFDAIGQGVGKLRLTR